MIYLALRNLHIACVVLSAAGFLLRGTWMLCDSPLLGRRWVRVVPHLVDSALTVDLFTVVFKKPVIHVVEVGLGNTLNVVEHVLLRSRIEGVEGNLNVGQGEGRSLASYWILSFVLTTA